MKNIFIEYPSCSTCKKAKQFLEEQEVSFTSRNIKENNPSEEEIKQWIKKYKINLKQLWNTSGLLYKEYHLKEKLPEMSEEEKIKLLSSDGMIVKRPILITEGRIFIGFRENIWKEELK